MNAYTPTPDYYELLMHSGIRGSEWKNHKYIKKVNGNYYYQDDNNRSKSAVEKKKKILETKYKNKESEKQPEQKSKGDQDKTQLKEMQYGYYKKYLDSLEDKKNAMSFEEFVKTVGERKMKAKNAMPSSNNDRLKMMREMVNRRLKAQK